jgi:phosphoglycerate dehydrogenase-like enzyme
MDNVIATPHVGFVTRDAYAIFYRETVENIVAWLDGHPIRYSRTESVADADQAASAEKDCPCITTRFLPDSLA